jgi:hypothetical protein
MSNRQTSSGQTLDVSRHLGQGRSFVSFAGRELAGGSRVRARERHRLGVENCGFAPSIHPGSHRQRCAILGRR